MLQLYNGIVRTIRTYFNVIGWISLLFQLTPEERERIQNFLDPDNELETHYQDQCTRSGSFDCENDCDDEDDCEDDIQCTHSYDDEWAKVLARIEMLASGMFHFRKDEDGYYQSVASIVWENTIEDLMASGGSSGLIILPLIPMVFWQGLFRLTSDVHVAQEFLIELIEQQPIKLMLFDLLFIFWISNSLPKDMTSDESLEWSIEYFRVHILHAFQLSEDAYLNLAAEYLELQHLIELISQHTQLKIVRQRQEEYFRFQSGVTRSLNPVLITSAQITKLDCFASHKVSRSLCKFL